LKKIEFSQNIFFKERMKLFFTFFALDDGEISKLMSSIRDINRERVKI
jgi:hypothetical protein